MYIKKRFLIFLFLIYSALIGVIPFLFEMGWAASQAEMGYLESLLDNCNMQLQRIVEK